jgi:hypothetical protein
VLTVTACAASPASLRTRSFISRAALLVNVTARMARVTCRDRRLAELKIAATLNAAGVTLPFRAANGRICAVYGQLTVFSESFWSGVMRQCDACSYA